jgi:uncharacterized protein (TIGR04562 family)
MEHKLSPEQASLLAYVNQLKLGRDVVELMLHGKSAIDSHQGLPPRTLESANRFLWFYGYDLENPIETAEVMGNYQEALRFIKKYFLKPENPTGASLEIPKVFYEITDLRELVLFSSNKAFEYTDRQRWACAILRVMHTISHLDKDLRHDYYASIQHQILDRFYKEIHNTDGKLFFGDPKSGQAVELVKYETKPRKTRDSAILKLLHKPENVAEDIFDQVGIRFVVKESVDVIRVLKILSDRYIIMPMNIRPSRSRNTLFDPYLYRRTWRKARSDVQKGYLTSPAEVDTLIDRALSEGSQDQSKVVVNPFSSSSYRSIQFTCRQLVKYRNPIYEDLKNLRNAVKKIDEPEIQKLADRVDLSRLAREQRFFYPFEVQIFDFKNYQEAENGRASHTVYKAAQVQACMRRVLGRLFNEEKNA